MNDESSTKQSKLEKLYLGVAFEFELQFGKSIDFDVDVCSVGELRWTEVVQADSPLDLHCSRRGENTPSSLSIVSEKRVLAGRGSRRKWEEYRRAIAQEPV